MKYDLIMVFKCLKKETNACQNMFKLSHNRNTRGHEFKLHKSKCHHQTLQHSLLVRVIDAWNELPVALVNVANSTLFKTLLDKISLDRHLKYDRRL